jgi:hypothetical protein
MKGSWPILALALGLVFLDQLGLGRLGSYWLTYHGPLGLLTNRCLETPRGYNLDIVPEHFYDHKVIMKA